MLSYKDRVASFRLSRFYEDSRILLDASDRCVISEVADKGARSLERNYQPGFGIFPSADPNSNYYSQVWTRDLAHAGGNYFATVSSRALKDSLDTIFRHQRKDGSLPSRVEREYEIVRLIPVLRCWSKPIFNLIERKIKRNFERPVYEGQDGAGGEDTVPAAIIGMGELFVASPAARQFVQSRFYQMEQAIDFFRTKTDRKDGLAIMTRSNPDWADTITRKGKLGGINVWWARALRLMEYIARDLGRVEDARRYRKEFRRVKKSVLGKLYDQRGGYFRAEENDARLDTVASIFGALYLLGPGEAVHVEEALKKRVERPTGLQNFAPPYPKQSIFWIHRLMGQSRYHNKNVWPWVTCENIQVMIKIALQHPNEETRFRYKGNAINSLFQMAELFGRAGGVGEVFDPDLPKLAATWIYTPPKDFMGSMAAYQGAYLQLRKLGWV
jgi:glycogen debranching enzyme